MKGIFFQEVRLIAVIATFGASLKLWIGWWSLQFPCPA